MTIIPRTFLMRYFFNNINIAVVIPRVSIESNVIGCTMICNRNSKGTSQLGLQK